MESKSEAVAMRNENTFSSVLTNRQKRMLEKYYSPFQINRDYLSDTGYAYLFVKRVMDVTLSSIALIALSPLLLVFIFAIYIEDPHGSPIFVQDRVGLNGKIFHCMKLRSMYCDAEERLSELVSDHACCGKAFKMKNDPRITKVGKFIRNTSIDELPQLINILKGDMSIVGSRPPLPREVEHYNAYEMQRLLVKPGLTCFWQIHPHRHEVTFEDWVAMDLKYIAERSILLDIKLIGKTICRVLKGHAD